VETHKRVYTVTALLYLPDETGYCTTSFIQTTRDDSIFIEINGALSEPMGLVHTTVISTIPAQQYSLLFYGGDIINTGQGLRQQSGCVMSSDW
jgi:hypothetical protein